MRLDLEGNIRYLGTVIKQIGFSFVLLRILMPFYT